MAYDVKMLNLTDIPIKSTLVLYLGGYCYQSIHIMKLIGQISIRMAIIAVAPVTGYSQAGFCGG